MTEITFQAAVTASPAYLGKRVVYGGIGTVTGWAAGYTIGTIFSPFCSLTQIFQTTTAMNRGDYDELHDRAAYVKICRRDLPSSLARLGALTFGGLSLFTDKPVDFEWRLVKQSFSFLFNTPLKIPHDQIQEVAKGLNKIGSVTIEKAGPAIKEIPPNTSSVGALGGLFDNGICEITGT